MFVCILVREVGWFYQTCSWNKMLLQGHENTKISSGRGFVCLFFLARYLSISLSVGW